MPAIVHLVSPDAIIGDAVVDDVLALDGSHDGAVHHLVVGNPALLGEHAGQLGERLLPLTGPSGSTGLRDLALLDDLGRLLREALARHGDTALHAHGPHARSLASLVGPAVGAPVIVDAGDGRPAHRLLPPPARTVYSSHGDLDRALEAGAQARHAALVPPGVDRAEARDTGQPGPVILDPSVGSPHLRAAFEREGFDVVTGWSAASAPSARLVVVGAAAHLGQAFALAVAAGVPAVGIAVPWAADLAGCASFHAHDGVDVDELLRLARAARRRSRKLPRPLGRAARTEALDELYGSLVGPRFRSRPPRRPSR